MSLSLGNDLSTTVGIQVDSANNKAKSLGQSLATGRNASVEVVDAFLGRSLESNAIILGAVAKNTAYTVNLLSITDEYLRTVVSSLQTGLKIISSSGSASADSLVVLQKNINDNKTQIGLLISTASFDGKNLLKGDATNIDVQVGLHVTDKLSVKIDDISGGKLFRSSIAKGLNDGVRTAADINAATTYYVNANAATEFTVDDLNNNNFVFAAMLGTAHNAVTGGHGSGGAMTTAQLGTLLFGLTAVQKTSLDQMAPRASAALTTANAGVTFVNATAAQLQVLTAAKFPTVTTMTTALDAMLGAVPNNGGTFAQTAGDVSTAINAVANLPQEAKDAATAAAAAALATAPASHNAARNAVRTAAYNALISAGRPYEVLLRSYPTPNATDFDAATAVATGSWGGGQLTAANTNLAVQASTTLSANTKSLVAAEVSAGISLANILHAGVVSSAELGAIFQDNALTSISVAGNVQNRVLAQDVFQNALNSVLSLQANVASQKSNVSAASDALRATTNVTQQAADSYLKTDYVLAAQEYSETIRTMVAAITSLQAANKIPEAAQRLIDVLAR